MSGLKTGDGTEIVEAWYAAERERNREFFVPLTSRYAMAPLIDAKTDALRARVATLEAACKAALMLLEWNFEGKVPPEEIAPKGSLDEMLDVFLEPTLEQLRAALPPADEKGGDEVREIHTLFGTPIRRMAEGIAGDVDAVEALLLAAGKAASVLTPMGEIGDSAGTRLARSEAALRQVRDGLFAALHAVHAKAAPPPSGEPS